MAKKPSVTTVTSGYQGTDTINDNFQNLRNGFDNTLSLDGSTPNAMQADLDMNDFNVLNVNTLSADNLAVGGIAVIAENIPYLADSATDLATRLNGDPLQNGDLYFNTTSDTMRVYKVGTGWIDYETTSQTAASTATSQAAIATSQAAIATNNANTAVAAANVASSVANSAYVNANVYSDTAAGLAGTTLNQQFQVSSAGQIIRYRHDSGPTATEVARFNIPPNSVAFEPVAKDDFSIVDPYGFANASANSSGYTIGTINIKDLTTIKLAADYQRTANGSTYWTLQDEYGFDQVKFTEDGLIVKKVTQTTPSSTPIWNYENHIILSMGQSLATGVNATPIYTSTQNYNTKMLSSGVRTYSDSPYTSATLAPLVEVSDAEGAESPIGGASDFINILLDVENGISYTEHSFSILGAATGLGSTPIGSHVSGTTIYTREVDVVSRFYSLSAAANTTAACLGTFWIQGESDVTTAQATYQSTLQTLRSDFTTSVQAITGQTQPVKFFTYQTASHLAYSQPTPNSALAQLAAANADANIYLATPMYHFNYADSVHLTGASSRHLGAYMGLAYKRVIIDGQDWKCLQPLSSIKQGNVCVITFDVPKGPLILDTTAVVDPGNYGFALVDSGGSALTISSVSLIGSDRIKIVTTSSIPAGAKVRYAWGNGSTANSGPITGARGCLRDSAGDYLPANFGKLHNWCVIFERSI